MDLLIFPIDDTDWFFASPSHDEQRLAPLTLQSAHPWRLWRAETLRDEQWDAAKGYFTNLIHELNKPGRRGGKRAA